MSTTPAYRGVHDPAERLTRQGTQLDAAHVAEDGRGETKSLGADRPRGKRGGLCEGYDNQYPPPSTIFETTNVLAARAWHPLGHAMQAGSKSQAITGPRFHRGPIPYRVRAFKMGAASTQQCAARTIAHRRGVPYETGPPTQRGRVQQNVREVRPGSETGTSESSPRPQ